MLSRACIHGPQPGNRGFSALQARSPPHQLLPSTGSLHASRSCQKTSSIHDLGFDVGQGARWRGPGAWSDSGSMAQGLALRGAPLPIFKAQWQTSLYQQERWSAVSPRNLAFTLHCSASRAGAAARRAPTLNDTAAPPLDRVVDWASSQCLPTRALPLRHALFLHIISGLHAICSAAHSVCAHPHVFASTSQAAP